MSRVLDRTRATVGRPGSILSIRSGPAGADVRFLEIGGKPAYEVSGLCDTCAFWFYRLSGADDDKVSATISATAAGARLRAGLEEIDPELVDAVAEVLPQGDYVISLLQVAPRLVSPGGPDDYFAAEQVRLWGLEPYWGLPHYPRVAYYRGQTGVLEPGTGFFEFVVPMYAQTYLDPNEVATYAEQLRAGRRPTAAALSLLSVKGPADWRGDPEVTEHCCLAHYLLDGHHKTFAAAQVGRPLTVLSFLSVGESRADEDDLGAWLRLA